MKAKRTYNISSETGATVRRLVKERHVAPTQDALVEQAISELARRLRDADDARLWQQAGSDPEFQEEARQIDSEFASDDARAWEQCRRFRRSAGRFASSTWIPCLAHSMASTRAKLTTPALLAQ